MPHTLNCICVSLFKIQISYLNFKAVLALPKTTCSAQTHKNIPKFHLNCLEHSICTSLDCLRKMCGYAPAWYSGKQVSSSLYEATFSQYLINLVKLTLDGTMGPKRIWTSQSWIFHVYLKYYLSNLRFMVGCLSQRDPLKCLMFRSGQSTLFNQSTTFNVPNVSTGHMVYNPAYT